jgi:hypothetical protein
MPTPTNDTFRIENGVLIRTVVPRRGKGGAYEHACTLAVFEDVAHAIDELAGQPTALDDLVAATCLPHSQVNTALAFLKERGCVDLQPDLDEAQSTCDAQPAGPVGGSGRGDHADHPTPAL